MPPANPERSSHFPAIEKKHGKPIAHWLKIVKKNEALKYEEQIALLRDTYGFSRAHANALVLYNRGNTSSRRFETVDDYLAPHAPATQKSVRTILSTIKKAAPGSQVVIAWNQPMLKLDGAYIFGISVLKNYILIAPNSATVIDQFKDELDDYIVNKKTIRVPLDWKPDTALLRGLVTARIDEAFG
ncbi:MAG TPA: hypothetical protein DHW34_04810 [Actinobacteria bacterium]|nr:hypothetical protein [Actinomycetota bacterium]